MIGMDFFFRLDIYGVQLNKGNLNDFIMDKFDIFNKIALI